MSRRILAAFFALSCVAVPARARDAGPRPDAGVTHVHIHSTWGGLGQPHDDTLDIERRGSAFFAGGRRIDAGKVSRLVRAVCAAPLDAPELSNVGITPEWLERNATPALRAAAGEGYDDLTSKQRAFFTDLFADSAFVASLLPQVLGGGWTDDYPEFELALTRSDGSRTTVTSKAQGLFMVPMHVEGDGRVYATFDTEIGRAVADLLPERFTNRARLGGFGLRQKLTEMILQAKSREWSLLETSERLGPELVRLGDRFALIESTIGYLLSIDVGSPEGPSYKAWNAKLSDRRLPDSVVVGISVPYGDGGLASLAPFHAKIDELEDRVLAVPWFAAYLGSHPSCKAELRFVTDRSMSSLAAQRFLDDLRAHGRERLADRLAPLLADAAFLEVDDDGAWSRWIVLPDRTMVLWNFHVEAPLGREVGADAFWDDYGWHVTATAFGRDGRPTVLD